MITYDVPSNLKKGLVSYITTSSQQGRLSGGHPRSQDDQGPTRSAIVISAADDNWYKMSGGVSRRASRSIDKKSKIFFATVSPTGYDDVAGGKGASPAQ